MTYLTILADPPWPQPLTGKWKSRHKRPSKLPYPTMTVEEIAALPVDQLAAPGCHLWLWCTNGLLEAGFHVMRAWGFTYLAPIHWIKPSGLGAWWIHRTQTMLFGYRETCRFPHARYLPNIIEAPARRHSEKPPESVELIEAVSCPPRLELFARQRRPEWHTWGNEVQSSAPAVQILGESPTISQRKG